jgi:hypothetical protein
MIFSSVVNDDFFHMYWEMIFKRVDQQIWEWRRFRILELSCDLQKLQELFSTVLSQLH